MTGMVKAIVGSMQQYVRQLPQEEEREFEFKLYSNVNYGEYQLTLTTGNEREGTLRVTEVDDQTVVGTRSEWGAVHRVIYRSVVPRDQEDLTVYFRHINTGINDSGYVYEHLRDTDAPALGTRLTFKINSDHFFPGVLTHISMCPGNWDWPVLGQQEKPASAA